MEENETLNVVQKKLNAVGYSIAYSIYGRFIVGINRKPKFVLFRRTKVDLENRLFQRIDSHLFGSVYGALFMASSLTGIDRNLMKPSLVSGIRLGLRDIKTETQDSDTDNLVDFSREVCKDNASLNFEETWEDFEAKFKEYGIDALLNDEDE